MAHTLYTLAQPAPFKHRQLAPQRAVVDRKPMEIEVERLPDYLWRDLGFQQPRRPDGE